MPKQQLNMPFTDRMGRYQYAIVPVITPQGNIKHLKVKPDLVPEQWLVCEWNVQKGRRVALLAVTLTTEREAAGATFLKDAYIAEGWLDGWKKYEKYLKACYQRTTVDDGQEVTQRLSRSRDDLHFPAKWLPKAVAERIAKVKVQKDAVEWRDDDDLEHPADRKARDERASIDLEKERLRAQLEREAADAPTVATVTKKPDGGVAVTHGPEKKGK
jgi:hypothetical protein